MRETLRLIATWTIAVVGLLALMSANHDASDKVEGRASVNGKAAPLTHLGAATVENLFDDRKQDVVVLLADKAVPADVTAADEAGLSLRARRGEFRAVVVRIDATKKLVDVKLFDKGIEGALIFGARDFELVPGRIDSAGAFVRMRPAAPATFSGTTLELDATFDVVMPVTRAKAPATAAPAPSAAAAPPDASATLSKILLKP